MTDFTIIEAMPYHCGQICRILRAEQRKAFVDTGINAHREMRKCFDASFLKRALMLGDRLVGVGGIVGSLLSERGYVWLALSDEVRRHPISFGRIAVREMRKLTVLKRELDATIVCADIRAIKFAYFLGFQPSHEGMKVEVMDVLHMRLGGGESPWPIQ